MTRQLSWTDTRLRARLSVRRTRRWLTTVLHPDTDWRAPLDPLPLGDSALVLRPPRLADAAAWHEQRTHERSRLERWFPVGEDWAAAHSRLVWAEQTVGLRLAALLGRARPHVALLDGRLVGQLGVDAVDRGTATGELSGWSTPSPVGYSLTRAGTAQVCLAALTGQARLRRVVAPVAVANRGPGLLLASLGFEREVVLRRYRATSEGRSDHEIWVLHRTPEVLARLRAAIAEESTRPSTVRRSRALQQAPVGTRPDAPGLHLRSAPVLARLAVRMTVGLLRARLHPVTDWQVPLGPHLVGGHRVLLRPPVLADAGAWVAARRRSEARLAPWTPGPGSWAAAQTPLAWAERCHRAGSDAPRGAARPHVVELDGVLVGQAGVVAVDFGTSTAELDLWLDPSTAGTGGPHALSRWVCAAVALDALTCEHGVDRLQVPVPVGHTAAAALLASVGFADEGVLRAHRETAHGLADHQLWVLHRDEEALAALRSLVG